MRRLVDGVCGLLLWVASWFVPTAVRGEWMREWRGEFWYARREVLGGVRGDWLMVKFCMGAFEDARALRASGEGGVGANVVRGSARDCGLVLAALLAISSGLGLLLPGVRARLWPSFVGDAQNLMLIEDTLAAEHGKAELSREQYRTWVARRQRIFQSFAFYEMRSEVLGDVVGHTRVRVAYASANLFDVLRGGVKRMSSPDGGALQEVVVSPELWRTVADNAPDGTAAVIKLGAQEYAVRGIAPPMASALPGHPNAWVLEGVEEEGSHAEGFILGRVNPRFDEAPWGDRWVMRAPEPDGSASDFTCVSLGQALRQPWEVCFFGAMLALFALPATTSLPLGEYPSCSPAAGRAALVRRWGFLVGKMGLVLAVVYFASMDLAFANPQLGVHQAEYVQLLSAFAVCLWGMRWSLRDQRQRCPVCLNKLTHPARVGQPSWTFLAWNGTELICGGGHGLMHVPELETSWFSTQRWLALDGSWQVLFAGAGARLGAP